MNFRALLFTALVSSSFAAEPSVEWVNYGGGPKNEKTRCVCIDSEGNVFLAGEATDDGTYGGITRKGLGGMDFVLVKINPQGKTLWVRSLGGSLIDRGYGVATDTKGNAYVTGHYQSTDAVANGQTLPNSGDYDIFVAKYDRDGSLQWVRTAGGKGYDYGHGIAVDTKGDIIVTGAAVGDATFGDQVLHAGRAMFVAKYDADGKLIWLRGTEGKAYGSAHGVAVDAMGNIYVGGSMSGEGSFGPQKFSCRNGCAFIAKLSTAGDVQWINSQEGTPSAGVHEITADAEGRVWVAGMFKGTMPIGAETFQSSGEKDSDGYLAHYDTQGKLQWARQLHGAATDYCLGVANDNHGNVFVTGEFTDTATFADKELKSQGTTDIFTAALDTKGSLTWVMISGGAKNDNAYTMAYQPDGHLVFAGAFAAPATFGSVRIEQTGGADLYGAKVKLP